MASLTIPESLRKGLLQIASLSEEQFQELYSALENIPLRINQKRVFDDSELELSTIPQDEFESIKETLFPVYLSRANADISASAYANDLARSLRETEGENEVLRSEEAFNRLVERLNSLLNIERAKLLSKTNDVLTEHARTYIKSRI